MTYYFALLKKKSGDTNIFRELSSTAGKILKNIRDFLNRKDAAFLEEKCFDMENNV